MTQFHTILRRAESQARGSKVPLLSFLPAQPPLEAGKMGGGGTERLGGPQRGGAVQDVEEGLQGMEEGATKWLKVQYQVGMPMYKNTILHAVSFQHRYQSIYTYSLIYYWQKFGELLSWLLRVLAVKL